MLLNILFMLVCAVGIYAWATMLIFDLFDDAYWSVAVDAIVLFYLMAMFYLLLGDVHYALTNT